MTKLSLAFCALVLVATAGRTFVRGRHLRSTARTAKKKPGSKLLHAAKRGKKWRGGGSATHRRQLMDAQERFLLQDEVVPEAVRYRWKSEVDDWTGFRFLNFFRGPRSFWDVTEEWEDGGKD